MSTELFIGICAASFVGGCWAGCKYQGDKPAEVRIEQHEVVKDRVVTQTKVVERKDGSKETDTVVTEVKAATIDKSAAKTEETPKPKWLISADANIGIDEKPFYGAQVLHSFIGPVSLGLRGDSRGTIGVVVGLSF